MSGRGQAGILGTGFRYFLTVLVGMSLSIVIAYGAVRLLTRGTVPARDATASEVDAGWRLRAAGNELARLGNAFTDAVPAEVATILPTTRQWLEGEYVAAIAVVQRELGSDALIRYAPARRLMDACGRLSALGNHPEDLSLRKAALGDLSQALDELRVYLRQSGIQRHVALPETPLRDAG